MSPGGVRSRSLRSRTQPLGAALREYQSFVGTVNVQGAGPAVRQLELAFCFILLLFRVLQGALWLFLLPDMRAAHPGYLVVGAAVAVAEFLWLLQRVITGRSYGGPRTAVVEVGTALVLMALGVAATTPQQRIGETTGLFLLVINIAAGLCLGLRLWPLASGTVLIVATYMLAIALPGRIHEASQGVANSTGVVAMVLACTATGAYIRRLSALLDNARDEAVRAEAEVTSQRLRNAEQLRRQQQQVWLHGSVVQTLTELCSARFSGERLPDIRRQARRDLQRLRAFLTGADPSTVSGVDELLDELDTQAHEQGLLLMTTHTPGTAWPILSAPALHALHVVASEAITNVHKHAGVTEATLSVSLQPQELVLAIADSGNGFLPTPVNQSEDGGFGLTRTMSAMRDVAGSVVIDSVPGGGTIVELRVPIRPDLGVCRQEPSAKGTPG